MILHLLYIIAFTILAVLAVANLIRNLITLSIDSQRAYGSGKNGAAGARTFAAAQAVPHPELLDESGRVINEPLLVMRSMTVEDAREHLDSLYESSPGPNNLNTGETRDDS